MQSVRKILLVGLDYAGKTSILNVLNHKYNLMDTIKPTPGIEREIITVLDTEIAVWDLGGQEKYRNHYLSDIRVFAESQAIFFVVDVLNPKRFEEALQYFTTMLILIESFNLNTKFIICLHKSDPNVFSSEEIQDNIRKATALFRTNARGHELSVFITSIYDIKSIIQVFSKTLQETIDGLKPFKEILKTVVSQIGLDGAALFDENMIIISEYYSNKNCEEICLNMVYNSIYNMRFTNPQLKNRNFAANFELILNLKNSHRRFRFLEVKFKTWILYLLTIGKDQFDETKVDHIFKSNLHLFASK